MTAAWFGPKGFASVVYALLIWEVGIPYGDTILRLATGLDNQIGRMTSRMREMMREWRTLPEGDARREVLKAEVAILDRMHLLKDVTSTISDAGVSILSARVDTIEDRTALSRFAFKAASVQHVEEVMRKIRNIPDVYDAYRVSRDGTPLEG